MKTNKKSNKKALFLSYDGLTDPLGQSQSFALLKDNFKIC